MKNIHTNFMAEYILKLTGEYASANRIHDVLMNHQFRISVIRLHLKLYRVYVKGY